MNNHLLKSLFDAFFFFHCIFLTQSTPAPLTIPEGTGVKLDSTKDPLGCSNFFKSKIFFFSWHFRSVIKTHWILGIWREKKRNNLKPWFSSPGYHVCFDMWVWCAFLATTVQIQPWVSTGHRAAMSRLLGQGVLLLCLQVIHTQLLGSGVIAPSCSVLSLRS